eukprot:188148-Rhodomonas_salina.3
MEVWTESTRARQPAGTSTGHMTKRAQTHVEVGKEIAAGGGSGVVESERHALPSGEDGAGDGREDEEHNEDERVEGAGSDFCEHPPDVLRVCCGIK